MRIFLFVLTALTLGRARAHTGVTLEHPVPGQRVTAPNSVTLTFSEPVDLRFSTFKVVPLPRGADAKKTAAAVLARKKDGENRADTAPRLTGRVARLSLPLRPRLKPGAYLVVWRVLPEDGHPAVGHATFVVR